MRKDGTIGSSLDAEVTLFCDQQLGELLAKLGDELRFVLITSDARLGRLDEAPTGAQSTELPGLRVAVEASAHQKCPRCWHHRPDVGSHPDHPELCGRCVVNVTGQGEVRRFA
jgi:isoleucyl-tRNA synthetase